MTRDEHLEFCKACKLQKFDPRKGIVCSLTQEIADFEEFCESYDEDPKLKSIKDQKKKVHQFHENAAKRISRFFNYLIDSFILLVGSYLLVIQFIALYYMNSSDPEYLTQSMILNSWIIINIVVSLLYYVVAEFSTGRTIGKFVTGTKVINLDGETPEFTTILLRTCCRFIPFEAFSFFSGEKSGWHDRLTETNVVRK